jgi:hypothetical protein
MGELTEDVQRALEFVLNRSGPSIERYLDYVFLFLGQNTDFYHVTPDPESAGVGFQEGVAEKLVQRSFFKYKNTPNRKLAPPPATKSKSDKTPEKSKDTTPKKAVSSNSTHLPSTELQSTVSPMPVPAAVREEVVSSGSRDDSPPRVPQSGDTFNGGRTDKYCWAQTEQDADVKIPLPSHITSTSHVKVNLTNTSLHVSLHDGNGTLVQYLSGQFFLKISTEDSCWNLDIKNKELHVFVEKLSPTWWKKLLTSEESDLDMRSLDTTTNLHDLPAEEQAVIGRLKYDELCKSKGQPTSQQQETQDILKKAWNAEGSPFAGSDYDPSKVSIS